MNVSMRTEELLNLKQQDGPRGLQSILQKRFSPRVFNSNPIPDDDVRCLLEAARWSPSSYNRQPWFFYWAANGTEGFQTILSLLTKENKEWAKDAGLLMVGCYISKDDRGENGYATYDLGQAVQSLVVEAMTCGYYTHQMGGFDREKAVEVLHPEPHVHPFVCIAVGKIGDYESASEHIVKKDIHPRHRKTVIGKKI